MSRLKKRRIAKQNITSAWLFTFKKDKILNTFLYLHSMQALNINLKEKQALPLILSADYFT